MRAGRVLLERNQLVRPGVEHRSDRAPGLFCLVGSDRQSGVPCGNAEKQLRVGRQSSPSSPPAHKVASPGRRYHAVPEYG